MSKIGIVSGYFNPLHYGHVKMINAAKDKCDVLYIIVNNDKQQLLKKDKIIMDQVERALIVSNLRGDKKDVTIAIDDDETVCETIRFIHGLCDGYNHEYTFFNGGDRKKVKDIAEADVCKKLGIKMEFGLGGDKYNSSSEINKKRGKE